MSSKHKKTTSAWSHFLKNVAHYADILAIPMFMFGIIYFYFLENKTIVEMIIFVFLILGFICDVTFTLLHFFILPGRV